MDYKQEIKETDVRIQYRFDLLKNVGDRLFINGGNPKKISASAYQHARWYGGKLSACRDGSGMVVELIEMRTVAIRVLPRVFYLEKLKAMKPGDILTFPWHAGRGSQAHPAYRDIAIVNRDRIEYLTQTMPEGLQVYRKKQA